MRPPSCTAGWPTSRVTSTCGRTCPAARSSTCWAALRGGLDEQAPGRAARAVRARPHQEGSRTYSKGNRQKVALVAALAADVELLLLDEPTSGLDPLMEAVFQECIDEFKDEGRTVLLSSHILAEVERLCDRVSIIRAGRTVETGTLAELRHLTRTSVVCRARDAAYRAGPARRCARPRRRGKPGRLRGRHRAARRGARGAGQLRASARSTSQPPTLEELFLRHYGDERRRRGGAA